MQWDHIVKENSKCKLQAFWITEITAIPIQEGTCSSSSVCFTHSIHVKVKEMMVVSKSFNDDPSQNVHKMCF